MEPREYEETVRSLVEVEVKREGQQYSEFRPHGVVCERSYPWTRLIVYFTRDDIPEVRFGFWVAIWRWVAWDELHLKGQDTRDRPEFLAGQFITGMSDFLVPDRSQVPYGNEAQISEHPVVRLIAIPIVW